MLVVAGVLCGVLIGGLTGQVLLLALVTLGLGGALLLVFYEVGLSEDRELERERRLRESAPRRAASPRWPRLTRRPRRPR